MLVQVPGEEEPRRVFLPHDTKTVGGWLRVTAPGEPAEPALVRAGDTIRWNVPSRSQLRAKIQTTIAPGERRLVLTDPRGYSKDLAVTVV